jgi:hypothetical protein
MNKKLLSLLLVASMLLHASLVNGTSINTGNNGKHHSELVKGHGCLMVFAFMFCLAASIFIARYTKFTQFSTYGTNAWLITHVSLNVFTVIVVIIAFLVILAEHDWKWLTANHGSVEYAHSIIGIITIIFLVLQLIIGAVVRPLSRNESSSSRLFFGIFHPVFGYVVFFLAVINIFLGVSIDRVNLGDTGWNIVLAWCLSILFIGLLMEAITIFFGRQTLKPKVSVFYVRLFLFFVYMIVIWAFMVTLVSLIGLTDITVT